LIVYWNNKKEGITIGSTLTAGAVRFFEFCSPHQVCWLFKVCAPQSCGRLAKALASESIDIFSLAIMGY